MRIWLSKTSEVPFQEQLCTQLILGIVSEDLDPGERLPSTSLVARRFHIHPNTVRSAYRELVRQGWADWRRGSGFFVRKSNPESVLHHSLELDRLISAVFEIARKKGYSVTDIQTRMTRWIALQPPDHVLVIEPDAELQRILIAEIEDHAQVRALGADMEEYSEGTGLPGALYVALSGRAKEIQKTLPAEVPCLLLHSRSIPERLAGVARPRPDTLITVVSRWPKFLNWGRTVLAAGGVDPTSMDLRDARRKGWERGLNNQSFIITDSFTARKLPKGRRSQAFQIIADESIVEIRNRFRKDGVTG